MALGSGIRLGPYEIVEPIGAGGMGEVYRGRDTRLNRVVAIKVLAAAFAQDLHRQARFDREAKAISALSHPNICQLYDVGRHNGTQFLVMEYLEGQTLADRLLKSPLPLSQALKIGIEIASALDRAHRKGIVHRDLKPGNVMLTREGAKLLDFGLAKDRESEEGIQTASLLTEEGAVLGTTGYMAPEQLTGAAADARSDIWALGVILYEMLAGRPAFDGDSQRERIAATVTRDPLPLPSFSPQLQHIVMRCLAKDPEDRWQSAHDVAEQLRWCLETDSSTASKTRSRSGAVVAAALLLTLLAAAIWAWRQRSEPAAASGRLSIALPIQSRVYNTTIPAAAISSDGKHVAFVAVLRDEIPQLFLRPFDSFENRLIADSAEGPFFSPDNAWIGFFSHGQMLKVRANGGQPQVIGPSGTPRGASWGGDNTIVYAPNFSGGLWRISADGSGGRSLTTPDEGAGENSHRWPQILPDQKHVLFTIRTGQMVSFDEAKIAVLSLETGKWRTVLEGGSSARYVNGHLVFGQRGGLMSVPFDLQTMSVRGTPRRILEGVVTDTISGAAHFAIAEETGTLVYLPGAATEQHSELMIMDRSGRIEKTLNIPRRAQVMSISPDQRMAVLQVSQANDDIWVYEFDRGTMTRVSSEDGDEIHPSWMPDSRNVIFGSRRGLLLQPIDGSAPPRLLTGDRISFSSDCSPDGQILIYATRQSSMDLMSLDLTGKTPPRPFLATPYDEVNPRFSPDGTLVAYMSNQSGRPEIYLKSLHGGSRLQVSSDGVTGRPGFSRDGRELYFSKGEEYYVVKVTPGSPPRVSRPELMFRLTRGRSFHPLGDGFILLRRPDDLSLPNSLHVIPQWTASLQ